MRRTATCVLALLAAGHLTATPARGQHGATRGEWRSHSGDLGATKYSPLDQITADNFADLEVSWHWSIFWPRAVSNMVQKNTVR